MLIRCTQHREKTGKRQFVNKEKRTTNVLKQLVPRPASSIKATVISNHCSDSDLAHPP